MKLHFYINFDLGIRGDYDGLYKWLDKNNAEERGNSYALIKEYNLPTEEFAGISKENDKNLKIINYIRDDIKGFVDIKSSDRIYLTFKLFGSDKLGGGFLFGGKHASAWEGHYSKQNELQVDFE